MNSRFVLVILAIVLTVTLTAGRIVPCTTDADCRYDKCCVLHFTGQGNVCRQIPAHVGAYCGGLYFCPKCAYNLVCTEMVTATPEVSPTAPIANDNATETLPQCPPPANSTCQPPQPPSSAAQPQVVPEL